MLHDQGKVFKNMREKAGLTQRQVAKALGYPSSQIICNIEGGKAAPPVSTIQALSYIYSAPQLESLVLKMYNKEIKRRVGSHKINLKKLAKVKKAKN